MKKCDIFVIHIHNVLNSERSKPKIIQNAKTFCLKHGQPIWTQEAIGHKFYNRLHNNIH